MGINKNLIEELNTLPKGYISTKKIHGKNYSYLQYDENGKLKSLYIRASEADSVREGLARRKEIEQETGKPVITSKNPTEIILPAFIVTTLSFITAIIAALVLRRFWNKKENG